MSAQGYAGPVAGSSGHRYGGLLRVLAVLPLCALAFLGGCDPCFGVFSCGGAVLSYEGQIYDDYANRPAAGVEVMMVRRSGVELEKDTVRVITGEDGRFRIRVPAAAAGDVVADFVIDPSNSNDAYQIRDRRLTTTRGENVLHLGRWPRVPVLTYLVELYYRGTLTPVADARVEFRRTRGIEVNPDTFVTRSNPEGLFWLTPSPFRAGTLYADLIVDPRGTDRNFHITELALETFAGEAPRVIRKGIGDNWSYVGEIRWADSGEPAPEVEVEFVQTGGPRLRENSLVPTVTNGDGLFRVPGLLQSPFAQGVVRGNLVIRPPAPHAPFTVTGVAFPTYPADEQRPAGVWEIGGP